MLSLILGTLGRRPFELTRLIESVLRQTEAAELIVVDQAGGARAVLPINVHIRYIRDSSLGLSRARNVGIGVAQGAVFGFPDDDCWYAQGILDLVAAAFIDEHLDGLVGRVYDPLKVREVNRRFWPRRGFFYKAKDIFVGSSVSMFLRREAVQEAGLFDVNLGAGAIFGVGEETDLLYRIIKAGGRVRYDPTIVVYHPAGIPYEDHHRAFAYGMGFGALAKKALQGLCSHRALFIFAKKTVVALGKSILYRVTSRLQMKYFAHHLHGLLRGIIEYK